jgi:hypothetical protein
LGVRAGALVVFRLIGAILGTSSLLYRRTGVISDKLAYYVLLLHEFIGRDAGEMFKWLVVLE